MGTKENWASHTTGQRITHYQTLMLFRSRQTHAETCALLLGDAWQMKIMCFKIGCKYQTCLLSSDWMKSKASLWPSYTTRFSVESFSCNLQTSSDFPQLASTCSNCKIRAKLRQKSCNAVVLKTWVSSSGAQRNLSIKYKLGCVSTEAFFIFIFLG